ncbi:hypothetical protein [Streptomyces sp. CT34]|uniref:hypothetical protein n=1 Tax=Streptomyces sp. CT34 TaxID=1553907 RepID=UPI0012FF26E3|nr:hypothetical protein [Streptomyces sp. CT34]
MVNRRAAARGLVVPVAPAVPVLAPGTVGVAAAGGVPGCARAPDGTAATGGAAPAR